MRRAGEDQQEGMLMEDRKVTAWETHFSTIATALILAAIMFTGGTLYSFGNKLTEFAVTLEFSSAKIKELSDQLKEERSDRVNIRDFNELRERVRGIEKSMAISDYNNNGNGGRGR